MNRHFLPPLVTLVAYIRAALTVAPNGQPALVYGIGQISPLRARRSALIYYVTATRPGYSHDYAVEQAARVLVPGITGMNGYEYLAGMSATESFLARVADQAARDLHPATGRPALAAA